MLVILANRILIHSGSFSAIILLEDDTVADGGQQIVEVELVFVVARIPAMLSPKFHQRFPKPGGKDGKT